MNLLDLAAVIAIVAFSLAANPVPAWQTLSYMQACVATWARTLVGAAPA